MFSNPGVKYTITVSTVKILSFWADRSLQTQETKIRLLLSNWSDQDLHNCYVIFHGKTGVIGGIYSRAKAEL